MTVLDETFINFGDFHENKIVNSHNFNVLQELPELCQLRENKIVNFCFVKYQGHEETSGCNIIKYQYVNKNIEMSTVWARCMHTVRYGQTKLVAMCSINNIMYLQTIRMVYDHNYVHVQ